MSRRFVVVLNNSQIAAAFYKRLKIILNDLIARWPYLLPYPHSYAMAASENHVTSKAKNRQAAKVMILWMKV